MTFTLSMTQGNSLLPYVLTRTQTGERFLIDQDSLLLTLRAWVALGYTCTL